MLEEFIVISVQIITSYFKPFLRYEALFSFANKDNYKKI